MNIKCENIWGLLLNFRNDSQFLKYKASSILIISQPSTTKKISLGSCGLSTLQMGRHRSCCQVGQTCTVWSYEFKVINKKRLWGPVQVCAAVLVQYIHWVKEPSATQSLWNRHSAASTIPIRLRSFILFATRHKIYTVTGKQRFYLTQVWILAAGPSIQMSAV